MLQKMYNDEFKESQNKVNKENLVMSQENLTFMSALHNAGLIDGNYHTPLTLHDDNVRFLDNRSQAEKRFTYLQRKISRNHQFKNNYMKFMQKLLSKGYATKSTAAAENRICWYLRHQEAHNKIINRFTSHRWLVPVWLSR